MQPNKFVTVLAIVLILMPAMVFVVAPRLVGRRSMVTTEGGAMLIHALAHIEFNATKIRCTH